MAACRCLVDRMAHQRGADAERTAVRLDRQRAEHERGHAARADAPQPERPVDAAEMLAHEGEAFGGQASVAKALAGTSLAIGAKAGVQQPFARRDVADLLRTDRERSRGESQGRQGNGNSGHGASVPTPTAKAPPRVVSKSDDDGFFSLPL
jgi:hypothetical protein